MFAMLCYPTAIENFVTDKEDYPPRQHQLLEAKPC